MSTYNSAKNRQSETRSSAWAFLLVGCIGFVINLLALLGVIRLPFGTFPLLIMEVMFVIFLEMYIRDSACPMDAHACFTDNCEGRSFIPMVLRPTAIAPELTRITSLPRL